MKKLLLLIVFSAGCIFAQSGIPGDDSKNSLMPPFYVNVLSAKSKAEGKSKFDIYFEVPFEGLQFLHADSVFTGLYRITCTITDESKENIFYDQSWLETVKTNSFEETTNPMNSNYSQKSVDLAPGKYRVSCNMQDVDSKRYYLFDGVFTLRSYKDSVGVSDPFIIDRTIKDNGVDQLIPNTARIITTKDKEIPVFFEAYADKPGSYSFEYCLRDAGGNIFYSKADTIIKLKAGTNEIYYTLKDFKCFLRRHSISHSFH